jgi:hypothetical protein
LNWGTKSVLVIYALLVSAACVVWVPRKLESPGETKRMTARYAHLWGLQKPPEDFVIYKKYDEYIEKIAEAALGTFGGNDPQGQAKFDSELDDINQEYPEIKNRKAPPKRPSDYVDPDMYNYASVDFARLGLEIVALSVLCGTCLILVRKPR